MQPEAANSAEVLSVDLGKPSAEDVTHGRESACCEGEGGFCCATECRRMREGGRLYPLLCALGILLVGMYFNCCMQVILHQELDPFYEVGPR